MGKQIRRTITITLTETWTFVWAPGDDHAVGAKHHPLGHPADIGSDVMPNNQTAKEESNEALQITINDTTPGKPIIGDTQVDERSSNSSTSRKDKRPQRRRGEKSQRSK